MEPRPYFRWLQVREDDPEATVLHDVDGRRVKLQVCYCHSLPASDHPNWQDVPFQFTPRD